MLPFVPLKELKKQITEQDLDRFIEEANRNVKNPGFKNDLIEFSRDFQEFYKDTRNLSETENLFVESESMWVSLMQSFLSALANNQGTYEQIEGVYAAEMDELNANEARNRYAWISILDETLNDPAKHNKLNDSVNNFDEELNILTKSRIDQIKNLFQPAYYLMMPVSNTDIGFLGVAFYFFKKRKSPNWIIEPAIPTPINNNGKIALFGDWGSGTHGAPAVSKSIEKDAQKNGRFEAIIHLGDIYYSGTEIEVNERFIKKFPPAATALYRRALNANHEMYSGGHGYFNVVLPNLSQNASHFSFENNNWIIIGLDTCYFSPDKGHKIGYIDKRQLNWCKQIIKRKNKSVVLITHNNLYDGVTGKSAPKLEEFFNSLSEIINPENKLVWYWGHEHACILFEKHPELNFWGRCIGHGGFAYERIPGLFDPNQKILNSPVNDKWTIAEWRNVRYEDNAVCSSLFLTEDNEYIQSPDKRFGANGYMTIEFEGSNLIERVHLPDGSVIYDGKM